MIHAIFSPYEAEKILQVPLPLQPTQDRLMWPFSKDGKYTVRSGHHSLQPTQNEVSSSTNAVDPIWATLWKAKMHPRCKELIWRAIQEAIPVKTSLKTRGIVEETICPVCGDLEESTITLYYRALMPGSPGSFPLWEFESPKMKTAPSKHGSKSSLIIVLRKLFSGSVP